jgi:predicted dehydrogenase
VPEVRPAREFGTLGGAAGDRPEHWLGFWHEHRHFVDAILGGREASSHFGDAVKTMELCERILHAGAAL